MASRTAASNGHRRYLRFNCGLFRSLFSAADALRQRRNEISHRADGLARGALVSVKAAAQGIDQR
jgi:hypothetical protein